MNQKELNELRRRFKPDRTAISKVYGCYVSSSRQIISYVDAPLGLLSQEEQEMYLNLLKKSLSGALGRNLIDIEFSTRQVADSDEHRLLQTLRQTECKDANARETLCRKQRLQRTAHRTNRIGVVVRLRSNTSAHPAVRLDVGQYQATVFADVHLRRFTRKSRWQHQLGMPCWLQLVHRTKLPPVQFSACAQNETRLRAEPGVYCPRSA